MCRRFKALDDFPRNRATKDGRATYCKPCHNQRMKEISERLYGGNANFLRQRRYGVSTEIQPVSRYWSFQLIESAIFAAVAVLLVAFTVRWVRHRIV